MDSMSCHLTPAEIKYTDKKDNESNSQCSTRRARAGRLAGRRPILASMDAHCAESRAGSMTPASPQRLQKRSAKHDRPIGRRTIPDSHEHRLNREESSSTLRSYYDRQKSPLTVSQQTSASSARDFALRKGCAPVIQCSHRNMTDPGRPEHTFWTNKAAPKKRPGRLDLSVLFPKLSPRSGSLLSPWWFKDSPPPVSVTLELPFAEPQSRTFLFDRRASETQEQVIAYPTQDSKTAYPSQPDREGQKSHDKVRNWFDSAEGDISEDGVDQEPEMTLDFVETAFAMHSAELPQEASFQPGDEFVMEVGPDHSNNYPLSVPGKRSNSRKTVMTGGNRVHHPSHRRETKAKNATNRICGSTSEVQTSAAVAWDAVDLREDSVLWLSSSDDEDENILEEDQRSVLEHREPLLRHSLGVDSIDSDVEIGTAQAVNTLFFRNFEPSAKVRRHGSRSSTKGTPKIQKLQAVEIPDRRSSKRGALGTEHQTAVSSSVDSFPRIGSADPVDHDSLLVQRAATAAPAVAQRQSPLVMALTPQEVSLLSAMRSKTALTRQKIFAEADRLVTEEHSSFEPTPLFDSPFGRNAGSRSTDQRGAASDVDSIRARKYFFANIASTESTLPSGRGSLIFSEDLPSPTTSRDSPATPTLDFRHELGALHDVGNQHGPGSNTTKLNQYGHVRCSTGSESIIMLDNFRPAQNESIAAESPWVFCGFTQRSSPAFIH